VARVSAAAAGAERLAQVDHAFRSLPERYLGAEAGFNVTYHIHLTDLGHTWEARCTPEAARVRKGATRRRPDVTISTDAQTWLDLREGTLPGVEAMRRGLLRLRGSIDLAVALEGLFRLPNGRAPLQRTRDVRVGRHHISTLTMGDGPDVLLLHGLGATRASLLYTAAALAERYRVHAPDLPGFGSSSKSAIGRYNARWFAQIMLGLMDELGIERAHVVGNSMGGRIALETGMIAPERVGGLGLLCPAVAWVRRGLHPIVRLLRPEFGMLPHSFARETVSAQFWGMFRDRGAVDPALADLMVDEFRRIYHSAGARYAFLASARNIYLEAPFGRGGFYPRLADLRVPALFIWCDHDPLVPAAFEHQVRRWLPDADQVVLEGCGHVPQVERPEETNELLMRFLARVDELGVPERPAAPARGVQAA
jgi:pimeloyl-ACP methyl ester carboxylesterase